LAGIGYWCSDAGGSLRSSIVFLIALVILGASIVIGIITSSSEQKAAATDILLNPQGQDVQMSFVSGTEYKPGQVGQVIVEARYPNGSSALEEGGPIYIFSDSQVYPYDLSVTDGYATYWDTIQVGTILDPYTGCYWDNSSVAYLCGAIVPGGIGYYGTNWPKGMQRKNTTTIGDVMGVRATIGVTYAAYAVNDMWMGLGDYDDSQGAEAPYGYDVKSKANGVYIYIPTMTLYQRTNSASTMIADYTDLDTCSPYCNGLGYGVHPWASLNISLYVYNGQAIVEENDVVVMNATLTNGYHVTNKTIYSFGAQNLDGDNGGHLLVSQVYDIVNASGVDIYTSALCNASVWYPDKSVFVDNDTMLLSDANGNAFIEFLIPNIDGVYEYQARCMVQDGRTLVASHSFHVTKPRIYAVVPK
jgi:hypothetical protein